MEVYMIVYKTTNKINNKIYVGKHNKEGDDYLGSGLRLKKAIEKYGLDNFKREILEHCTEEVVNKRETYWIKKLESQNPKIGYNLAPGGDGGNIAPWTKERKQKIRDAKKNKYRGKDNPNYGNHWSDKQKANLSKKLKGKTAWNRGLTKDDLRVKSNSDKRKKTMDEKNLWKRGENHPRYKKIDENKFVQLYNEGIGCTKLGRIFNLSTPTVRRKIKLYGLKPRRSSTI